MGSIGIDWDGLGGIGRDWEGLGGSGRDGDGVRWSGREEDGGGGGRLLEKTTLCNGINSLNAQICQMGPTNLTTIEASVLPACVILPQTRVSDPVGAWTVPDPI